MDTLRRHQHGFRSRLLRPWLLLVADIAIFSGFFIGFAYFRGEYAKLGPQVWISATACMSIVLLAISLVGAYDPRVDMKSGRFTSEYLIAGIVASVLGFGFVYTVLSFGGNNVGRATTGLTLFGFLLTALVVRRRLYPAIRFDLSNIPFWVLGAGPLARDLYTTLKKGQWTHPLRFFSLDGEGVGKSILPANDQPPQERPPVVEADLFAALKDARGMIGGIVLAEDFSKIPVPVQQRLVSLHFQGLQVLTLDSFYSRYWKNIPVDELTPAWALSDGFQLARSPVVDRVKRAIDLVIGGILFLGGLLLLPLIAIIIRLESPGPIIFRQQRVGRLGRRFTVYKFRTMRVGSDKQDSYTRQGDKRVTKFGYFLRKSRLDELPQVWNVLKGEMSVIGPRAEWDQLVEKYERIIPYYNFRHLVKPGITGWAQVNYPYGENERDAVEKLKYDLYYVRHYSILLDFTIVLKTIYIMCGGKGQ
jgi:exopolysaccharide biosynthesis polyprenyl glycosylphosphotransferase